MNNTAEVMEETGKRVAEYNVTDAAIAELAKRSTDVLAELEGVDIGTGAQYEVVKSVEAPIRKLRVQVESKRKELKADALAWGRLVDTEAKRITAALLKAEIPTKELRLKWDENKERIKAEREAAIKKRMDYLVAALDWMKGQPLTWHGLSAPQLENKQAEYMAIAIDERWEEFAGQAHAAHAELLESIDIAVTHAVEAEEAAAAQRAEAERLANEREKLAAEQAEAKRLADEERRQIDEARAKLEAEQAESRAAIAKAEEEFDAKRAADRAEKDRVERERQIKEQAEADAKAAAERAATEKQEQEKQAELDQARKEELRPDKEKLAAYIVAIAAASEEKPNLEHNDSLVILASWELELCAMLTDWKTELEAGQ